MGFTRGRSGEAQGQHRAGRVSEEGAPTAWSLFRFTRRGDRAGRGPADGGGTGASDDRDRIRLEPPGRHPLTVGFEVQDGSVHLRALGELLERRARQIVDRPPRLPWPRGEAIRPSHREDEASFCGRTSASDRAIAYHEPVRIGVALSPIHRSRRRVAQSVRRGRSSRRTRRGCHRGGNTPALRVARPRRTTRAPAVSLNRSREGGGDRRPRLTASTAAARGAGRAPRRDGCTRSTPTARHRPVARPRSARCRSYRATARSGRRG